MNLYTNDLKNWDLELAKAPGFDLPKSCLHYNISTISKIESRKLSLRSKRNYSNYLCIYFILMLLFPVILIADDTRVEPAPLMTFSKELSLALDSQNEKLYQEVRTQQQVLAYQEGLAHQFPWKLLWLPIALAFGLLLRRNLLLYWQRSRTPEKTARTNALAILRKAYKLPLETEDDYDKYYTLLTTAVRRYFTDKYAIPAITQTTAEILKTMTVTPIFDNDTQAMINSFFLDADQYKFAELLPTRSHCEESYRTATKIISKD